MSGGDTKSEEGPFIAYKTKDYIEIFRHQQPHVAEMMIDVLRQHNIPCYLQEGAITSILKAAVFPAAFPGVEYVVFVPKAVQKEAQTVIEQLPFDRELLNVKWRKSPERIRQIKLVIFWTIIFGTWAFSFILAIVNLLL